MRFRVEFMAQVIERGQSLFAYYGLAGAALGRVVSVDTTFGDP
jgi:hypothetical protein